MLGSETGPGVDSHKHLRKNEEREETQAFVARAIRPCRVAIFLNIWSSIFTAAFFAYVKPAGSVDTEVRWSQGTPFLQALVHARCLRRVRTLLGMFA